MTVIERKRSPLLSVIGRQKEDNRKKIDLRLDKWDIYGSGGKYPNMSGVEQYEECFEEILGGTSITEFVRKREAPVVVDLMAPSDIVAELLGKIAGPGKLGLAVSFLDIRTAEQKERDRQLNVHQIGGDIMQSTTWKQIRNTLNGRKADLIMERALGGHSGIPVDERFYLIILNRIWNLLSDQNGMFIGEFVPWLSKSDNVEPLWIEQAQRNGVDISCLKYDLVKVIKTPSSPEDLRSLFR